jgi:hypothetical protein
LSTDTIAARFACLLGAIFIYACFGSPSPDYPSMPEIVTGFLLALAVGLPAAWNAIRFDVSRAWWQAAGQLFLIYGLIIAAPMAFMQGNDAGAIIRDIAPFLFLLLPVLAGDIFEKRPHYAGLLMWAYVFLGLMFAWRSLSETSIFNPNLQTDTRELYYFANSPAVLFAAVFPAGLAMEKYLQQFTARSLFVLVVVSGCTMLAGLAMAVTLQRASIAWAIVAFGLFFMLALKNAPYRISLLVVLGLTAVAPFYKEILMLTEMLAHKTEIYGINKRGDEMRAVWDEISMTPTGVLFGLGWGATFESPAVGGVRVNYTHNFFSGMLLKTGITGAMLMLAYVSGLFMALARLARRDLILAAAIAGPLLIDVILYASYKWLDFGLLLLLVGACAAQLHQNVRYCIHFRSCEGLPSSS